MMKKLRNVFSVILIAALIATLCAGCGGSASDSSENSDSLENLEDITIRIGHGVTEQHSIHIGILEMKSYIEEKSGGKIKVEIFPNAQMGGEREMVEAVQNNTLEIAYTTTGPFTSFVPEFMVLDIPFQFKSYEEAWMVLDSTVGQQLKDAAEARGFKVLSFLESGMRHITTASKPIRTPDDLKGLKIRTMEAAMHMANFSALGANPTPVSWSELYLAMQQNMVDGQENPLANILDLKMYEVQSYLTLSAHLYDAAPFVANTEWWDALPTQYQTIISNGAMMASNVNRFLNYLQEEEILQTLKDKGMEVIELTDAEREPFKDLGQPAVIAEVKKELGDEFVDNWLQSVEELIAREAVS